MIAPRVEFRTVRVDELQCLFAIIHKIKLAPVVLMVEHWRTMAIRTGKIEITSLVTRIATYIRALVGAQVTYLETPRETFDEEHFVQAHLLKRVEGELVMLHPRSSTTIILPCPDLGLYQVRKLTLNLASEDDAEMIRPSGTTSLGPDQPPDRALAKVIGTSSQKAPHSKRRHLAEQDPLVATSSSHSLAEASPLVPLSAPAQHTLSEPVLQANQPTTQTILRATRTGTIRSCMASSTRAFSILIITSVASMQVLRG
jgi:hypothetical protein